VVVSAQVHRQFSSLSASLKVVYANGDGEHEDLFNKDLIELGLPRTTTCFHACCREFERLRENAEERGAGLWSACPCTEP